MEISQDLLAGVRSFGHEGQLWLDALPPLLERLSRRWDVAIERPGPPGSCSYIAVVRRRNGDAAVLKVPIPHEEALHESSALRVWDGNGAVELLDVDESGAMLLELVVPGTTLAETDGATDAARIGGELLRRLHRPPPPQHPFASLRDVLSQWAQLAKKRVRTIGSPEDVGHVDEGAELLEALPREATESVLLHGDFHHWNVLAATREPWVTIDPKPMIGDPAFDAAQFLGNHYDHVRDASAFLHDVHVFADAAGLDAKRMLLYAFAKTAEDAMWSLSIDRPGDAASTLEYGRFVKELLR